MTYKESLLNPYILLDYFWECAILLLDERTTAPERGRKKNMNKLENLKLIKNRIIKLSSTAPRRPLRGLGNDRLECTMPNVFSVLQKFAPNHCEQISNRVSINSYGKIGYPKFDYISPELNEIVMANYDDFVALEKAMQLIADCNF